MQPEMLSEQVSSSDPSVRRTRWSGQSGARVVLDADFASAVSV
jgi:hypothetical protein